jgi:GNAT superfamily N-acetyltransferase
MNADTEYRVERVLDLDAVWTDLTALFLEFEAYHQAFQPRQLLPDWQARLAQRLQLHYDRLILLARADGDAVGCLVGVIRRDDGLAADTYGYLTYAFVQESHRRGGVGRALLAEAEAWCRQRGATRVELDVFDENELAVGFWSASGFRPLSLTMSKTLEPAI